MAAVAALKLNIEIVIVFATISLCSMELHSTLFIRCKTRVKSFTIGQLFSKNKTKLIFSVTNIFCHLSKMPKF